MLTKSIVELGCVQTSSSSRGRRRVGSIVRRIVAVRGVEWLQCCTKGTPESAKRAKDDHGEGVADDELKKEKDT